MRWVRRLRPDERGDAGGHALELMVIAPVLLVFVCLLAAFGRFSSTSSKVDAAAASAARAASQQHDQVAAVQAAADQARAAMAEAGLSCAPLDVITDASAFALPVGEPGSVVVEIRCTLDLSDVAMPGIPGTAQVTGRAASPMDIYQERLP